MKIKNIITNLVFIGTMGIFGSCNYLEFLDDKPLNLSSLEENKQALSDNLSDSLKIGPYDINVTFGKYLHFRDNNAVGMRAYIKMKDKELELEKSFADQELASFEIPEPILKNSGAY